MAFNSISNWKGFIVVKKNILLTAVILGLFSVLIGAFGAHALQDYLVLNQRVDTFEIACKYQFYHVFLLLFMGLLYDNVSSIYMNYAFYFCLFGIFLFSGSLYFLCLTNNSFFGMITPIGGLSFIFAWFMLFMSILKKK
tara:strand:+ start:810 stop:1226 length:417 start_codon:yes stop_codon:yes gene_type:complete